jgi:hypothetical protein
MGTFFEEYSSTYVLRDNDSFTFVQFCFVYTKKYKYPTYKYIHIYKLESHTDFGSCQQYDQIVSGKAIKMVETLPKIES